MVEANLVFPIIRISLTHVVLDGEVGDLLMDKHYLNVVARVDCVSFASWITYVKSAACAHWHAAIRDANVIEDLKLVAIVGGLTLHQLYICYYVFDDGAGYLSLRISKVTLLHIDIETVCKKELRLFLYSFRSTTSVMLRSSTLSIGTLRSFRNLSNEVSLPKIHVLERLIRYKFVRDVGL